MRYYYTALHLVGCFYGCRSLPRGSPVGGVPAARCSTELGRFVCWKPSRRMHWFSWRAHLVLCCKWSGAAPLHHLLVTLLSTYEWPFTLARHTHHTKYGLILGTAGLTHWSHSLATAVPSIASAAQSDHDYAIRPSLSPFPQPTSHLVRSAQAGFPRPTTQLNLPSLH